MLAGGLALSATAAFGAEAKLEVVTKSGRLRGALVADGVRAFKGVPYAEAPVGPLRFKAPVPIKAWTGVRDATQFGNAAIQNAGGLAGGVTISEDCLNLNVWAPTAPGPHPVFVWIQAGGNQGGSISHPGYDGAAFARDGVIFVSMNYRVGALGFLELGEAIGPEYAGSGNNGVKDMVECLRWVKANISAFGGDPNRVTLGAFLSGAKNGMIILTIPAAKGLFQRAIMQSGWTVAANPSEAHMMAKLSTDAIGGDIRKFLTATPAEILTAQGKAGQALPKGHPWGPWLDGKFIIRQPREALQAGVAREIPLLLGADRDETALGAPPAAGQPARALTAKQFSWLALPVAEALDVKYRAAYPELSDYDRRIRLATSEEAWIPTVDAASAHARHGGQTWLYRFDASRVDGPRKGRAINGVEVAYAFDNLDKPEIVATGGSVRPEDRVLATQVHTAWVAFIKGKAPAAQGLPAWPQYDETRRMTLIINHASVVESDPWGVERSLWKDVAFQPSI